MQYVDLPLEAIRDHPDNPRRDLGDLTELVDSIKAKGILQSLVVVPDDDDQYLLIAGHRRKAAAALAGLESVPAIVRHDLTTRADQVAAMLTEISDKLRREHSLTSAGSPAFWQGLADHTIETLIADQVLSDHALRMLGLDPLGDEDDLDDWILTTCSVIESRGLRDRVILLAHPEAQDLAVPERSWRLSARDLIAARDHLGYVLSDAEQAVVDGDFEEASEAEQEAS